MRCFRKRIAEADVSVCLRRCCDFVFAGADAPVRPQKMLLFPKFRKIDAIQAEISLKKSARRPASGGALF